MKTLTLLRHAKSGWDDPALRDFDRPLNPKGQRAARTVGRALKDAGLAFDAVIASPALRVKETLRGVGEGYGRALDVCEEPELYLASAAVLLDQIQRTDDGVERLLLVGHNPGLEDLAIALSGSGEDGLLDALGAKYPTATVAVISFDSDRWADVDEGKGRLVRFLRPRDLDPDLGPEDDG